MPDRDLARAFRDGVVHLLPAEHRADGRIARAETLRGGDDVGHEGQGFGGEPVAGAADTGDDLVEADEETVSLAAFGEAFPESLRRRVRGERGRADGLAEVRRDCLRARRLERAVQSLERLLAGGVEAPGARRDVEV